jgi:hypothetical protein
MMKNSDNASMANEANDTDTVMAGMDRGIKRTPYFSDSQTGH